MRSTSFQRGAINGTVIAIVGLAVGLVAVGSLAIWSFLQYDEARTDVDGQIALSVSQAERELREQLEERFLQEEKKPNRQFVGPTDYGRVTFDYPKTWSVYVARDALSGGNFEAYLNPVFVPQVKQNERYALRVLIENRDYEDVLASYRGRIDSGDLRTSTVSVDDNTGQRIDGAFTNEIRGSAVLYKIRDKTLTIRADAETFKSDFDELIKTIEFNR